MKTAFKSKFTILLFIVSIFFAFSCKSDDDNIKQDDPNDPNGSCYVHLFDGDNFTDDNIIVKGPGEFSNLENLPGSKKDWNDEADSFKSGKNTTVTFWTKTNFEGESITYKGGEQKASMEEPKSMKISCK